MILRLCWAIGLLGVTCMAQNAVQIAHAAAKVAAEAAAKAANYTRPPLTGDPRIDYLTDPNLPIELHGYDLSNYPFYNGLPDDLLDPTIYNFTCDNRLDGFYASVHHQCQVYHNCLFNQRYDFLCANYTVFDQKNFICHYVSLVDCANSEKHFDRNEELYVTTSTTTERSQQPQVIYIERPARPRPAGRPRPRPAARPFFRVKNRPPPPPTPAPLNEPTDAEPAQRQPSGGRRPIGRRRPAVYDDYYNYDDYYSDTYYDDDYYYYDYADESSTTTTTSTTLPPPPRRKRPQRTRLGPGRRPGVFSTGNRPRPNIRPPVPINDQSRTTRLQEDDRPAEQDINSVDKDSLTTEPERRQPINRRRPALRPNKPVVKTTTPADPFIDYYDYDNTVSEEPSSTATTTTTPIPVVTTRRPTRPRFRPRRPEPTTEETLVSNDQEPEENNLPSTETIKRKPINARRPFRPAPEEPSPVPTRPRSESPVNARQPFRPKAEESSLKEEVPARESLGSGRRPQGPRFPSRRKPVTETKPEEETNPEEAIIEDAPPLAPGIDLNSDGTLPEEAPVAEISNSGRPNIGRRVRIGGRRRPQRHLQPDYYYYEY